MEKSSFRFEERVHKISSRKQEDWRRPCPERISAATSKVIELFQDTPLFVGLAGFETNCSNGKPILLNFHFRINMEHYELNVCFITSHAGLSSIQHHQFQVITHLRKSG